MYLYTIMGFWGFGEVMCVFKKDAIHPFWAS